MSDRRAFIEAILAHPADDLPRLALADWLEEHGEPDDATWAGFIRAVAAIARDPDRPGLRKRAEDLGRQTIATTTLPAGEFLRHADALLQLYPEPNIAVVLAGHDGSRTVIELVPESVARESQVFPLHFRDPILYLAAADPGCLDTYERLEFILARPLVVVGADPAELQTAIDEHYGTGPIETVESVSYIFPDLSSAGGEDARAAGGLFICAFQLHAAGFEVELGAAGGRVTYLPGDRPLPRDGDIPAPWLQLSEPAFARLYSHLDGLPVSHSSVAGGIHRREVEVPAAITERWPVDFDVRDGERTPRWLRVVFRWERLEPDPPPRRRR